MFMPVMLMRLEMGNVISDLFTKMGSAATAKARRTVVNKVVYTMTVASGAQSISVGSGVFYKLKKSSLPHGKLLPWP
jgi:hypothetical protein